MFVGDTNTGEQMRSHGMRLRWPFIEKILHAAASAKGLSPELEDELAELMEQQFKGVLPEVTEDFGAGNISATIAGRRLQLLRSSRRRLRRGRCVCLVAGGDFVGVQPARGW